MGSTKPAAEASAPAAPSQAGADKPDFSSELEWIRFREETLGPAAYQEAATSKLWRKIKANPFVPVGAMATLGALSYGLWCFRQGRTRDSQMLMRARIGAQGFTIVAILAGVAMGVTTAPQRPPPPLTADAESAPAKT